MILDAWVNVEKKRYDKNPMLAMHYTQIIWHDSYMIGCGYKGPGCSSNSYVMTCNYAPAGNYMDAKADNAASVLAESEVTRQHFPVGDLQNRTNKEQCLGESSDLVARGIRALSRGLWPNRCALFTMPGHASRLQRRALLQGRYGVERCPYAEPDNSGTHPGHAVVRFAGARLSGARGNRAPRSILDTMYA
eukprot:gene57805-biopygen36569